MDLIGRKQGAVSRFNDTRARRPMKKMSDGVRPEYSFLDQLSGAVFARKLGRSRAHARRPCEESFS